MRDQSTPPDPPSPPAEVNCPDCGAALTRVYDRCPRCALPLRGPAAINLWQLDGTLARLRVRETELLAQRELLLDLLRAERARHVAGAFAVQPEASEPASPGRAVPASPGRPVPASPGRPVPAGPVLSVPRRDVSPRAVQNMLLILGGLLLAVAAVAFTVVSWGHLGIGGRAVILAGITGLALAAPKILAGRGLVATAETIAMLGVALLFLDGYAARRVGLAGLDDLTELHYAALIFGLVALVMAAYSRLLPLRLPLPVAIVLAQLPLPLFALGETAAWLTAALAVTAAADANAFLLADRVAVPQDAGPERVSGVRVVAEHLAKARVTLGFCFGVLWTLSVGHGWLDAYLGSASYLLNRADLPASVPTGGVLLILLGVLGVAVAPRAARGRRTALTAGSASALTAGLAASAWPLLPADWRIAVHTVAALAVAVAALRLPWLRDPLVRRAGALTAAVLAALTALPFLPVVIFTLVAPLTRLDDVWSGSHRAVGGLEAMPFPQGVLVLGLLAAASAVAARQGRAAMWPVALAVGTVTVAVTPTAFGWSYAVDLAVLLALAVTLVTLLALAGRPWWARVFAVLAGPIALLAVATALTERSTTYAALAVLLVACGLAAFTARVPGAAAAALVMAVLSATGLIWAVATGTGWQPAAGGLSLSLAVGALLAGLLALRRWSAAGAVAVPAPDGATAEPDTEPAAEKSAAGEGVDDPRRTGGLVLGTVLAMLALLSVLGGLARILGFYRPLAAPWTALRAPADHHPLLVVVTALVGVTAVLVFWQFAGRRGALRAGLVAWPVVLAALPLSVALPYGLEVGLFVAGLAPLAWMAARSRTNGVFAGTAALWTASIAVSWALMNRPATLAVLPLVAVIAGTVAWYGRVRAVRVAGAGLATLLAGAEAFAAGMALDLPVRHAAFGVLAVACLAAAVAGRFRNSTSAIGVETAGYALAAVGLPLAAADLPLAGLACAVVGVLMAGTALRADRRWAGYVGTGLLLVASWLRLLASDITVVEAYTVPFSLVLLAFGWWRARTRETSSWVSYGSGLASSLIPSMVAMLGDTGWVRPLLLGVVSLAVLLAGARLRLQAPVLLGGLTLAVVALHELTPWIAQIVVTVPRWVPMAAGGLLLVVVGATYEARLGEVRRLRAAFGRMR
ncbi:SCO7613 C-terminal domain-containing membrane protein [Streptosporangium sp. NPDC087985]|uniref:SCO7613 C-terminal domain-containing membrane protein n=1 Tax=Streptosporangium sp. NPDC087985 TaxID=3366196 RepID=UPI0037F790B1